MVKGGEFMWPLFFVAFFFLLLIPLILAIVIPVYNNHKTTTGKVINYDSMMRKYVYKVYMSKEEIIYKLQNSAVIDELSCDFDLERSVIKFSEYGSNREYYFQIQEYNEFSVLRLEQVALIGMSSHIPLKLNPFLVSKLQAEIIPFSQYGF